MTTNAGIPGTGLSYRSNLGTHGSWFGVVLLVGTLAFWADKHMIVAPAVPNAVPATTAAAASPEAQSSLPASVRHLVRARRAPLKPGPVFVHRGGAVVRETEKPSGKSLKKESKGARIRLLALDDGGWAKMQDGDTTGFMRAGTLGMEAPRQ